MKLDQAAEITLELARQNIIDDREFPEEAAIQKEAINQIEDFFVNYVFDE